MTELRELKLAIKRSPVPLRDEDMAFLKQLTRLENLISVLTVLHSWPQLKDLDMRKTNITDAGVAELMKANSQVKVRR
jgi:hypothetical protein